MLRILDCGLNLNRNGVKFAGSLSRSKVTHVGADEHFLHQPRLAVPEVQKRGTIWKSDWWHRYAGSTGC